MLESAERCTRRQHWLVCSALLRDLPLESVQFVHVPDKLAKAGVPNYKALATLHARAARHPDVSRHIVIASR